MTIIATPSQSPITVSKAKTTITANCTLHTYWEIIAYQQYIQNVKTITYQCTHGHVNNQSISKFCHSGYTTQYKIITKTNITITLDYTPKT